MNIIRLLCLTCLRIVHANNGKKCYLIELSMFDQLKHNNTSYQKILSANTQQCTHEHASKSKGSVQMTCDIDSKWSVTFERIFQHNKFKYERTRFQCKGAGTPVGIICPPYTAVNTEYKSNGDCSVSDLKVSGKNHNTASKDSFMCTILIKTADKKMSLPCKGVTSISGHEKNTKSYGIPDYVFILGGIAGVLIVTCIIVGVFLLRKRNCSEFRNTQMTSNDQVVPTVNTTYNPAGRPNKNENNHQANLVNVPGGQNHPTSHAVYFDNRTDDKAIRLCPIKQPGIQTNKNESNTYSHLRTTSDDPDDMYDHSVRNAVRNTCGGDYDVAHIRITEDDNYVSGNYHHSPTNKEDPAYTEI